MNKIKPGDWVMLSPEGIRYYGTPDDVRGKLATKPGLVLKMVSGTAVVSITGELIDDKEWLKNNECYAPENNTVPLGFCYEQMIEVVTSITDADVEEAINSIKQVMK